jgi:methylated-DNA-[protein]-cysteine S-methyltransferase
MNLYYQNHKSEIGEITLGYTKDYLVNISFGKNIDTSIIKNSFFDNIIKEQTGNEFIKEIEEYLNCSRKTFEVPYKLYGSKFCKSVWQELLKVKYGELKTYKDIALSIGGTKYSRAVGLANGKNPLPIIVPCHRIIKSDGSLGGYSSGIEIKKKLLKIEGINVKNLTN